MSTQEKFLSQRERYKPISLPEEFSDEEMARDWTLSDEDKQEVSKYRKNFRLFIAVQICSVRLYGRFLGEVHDLSSRIVNYLNNQLGFPPSLTIKVPDREATYLEHHKNILTYLGFHRFDNFVQEQLRDWIEQKSRQGVLPSELFQQAERYLLDKRVLLPGPSTIERLIINICAEVNTQVFETIHQKLSPELKKTIDQLLTVPEGEQRSYFNSLKEYPPAAKVSSLQTYLKRYQTISETGIDSIEAQLAEPAFQDYLFRLTKKYNSREIKRFSGHKRYALMVCFLLESRKVYLDYLVTMHDQYIVEIYRKSKNAHEKKHRKLRKRQKKAVDVVLKVTSPLLGWADDELISKDDLWQDIKESEFQISLEDLRAFKQLEERGHGDLLVAKYPSMRKYFRDFVNLPFAAEHGSDPLMKAIRFVRQLDSEELKSLPKKAPTAFVPKELQRILKDEDGNINRNAWEMGLALATFPAKASISSKRFFDIVIVYAPFLSVGTSC